MRKSKKKKDVDRLQKKRYIPYVHAYWKKKNTKSYVFLETSSCKADECFTCIKMFPFNPIKTYKIYYKYYTLLVYIHM